MISIEDGAHEFVEVGLEPTIGERGTFLSGVLCSFVVVLLLNEGREEDDVGVGPGGFALEEVVDLALAGGTGGYGCFVGDFGFTDFALDVLERLFYEWK